MDPALATLVGFLMLTAVMAGVVLVAAGKIAQAIAERPIPAPQIITQPAPPPPPQPKATGIRIRWEEEEVEFSPKDASSIISELITDVFRDLTAQDKMLLKNIYRSHTGGSLHRLSEDFRRGSQEHQLYRRLRDCHLIRPVEGKFLPAVRIEMTEFGLAVIQRFPALLESDDTGIGIPAMMGASA